MSEHRPFRELVDMTLAGIEAQGAHWRRINGILDEEFGGGRARDDVFRMAEEIERLRAALRHFAYPGPYTGQPTQEEMIAQARAALGD